MLSEVICSQSFSCIAWTAGPVRRDFFSCHHKLSRQPHHCKVFVYSYLAEVSTMAASLGTKLLSKLKCKLLERKIIGHPDFLKFFSPSCFLFSKIREQLKGLVCKIRVMQTSNIQKSIEDDQGKDYFEWILPTCFSLLLLKCKTSEHPFQVEYRRCTCSDISVLSCFLSVLFYLLTLSNGYKM